MAADSPDRPPLREVGAQTLSWSRARFRVYWYSQRFWMVLTTATVVLGVAGALGIGHQAPLPNRLLAWALILTPSVITQLFISLLCREGARKLGHPWGAAAFLAGVLGAPVIAGWIALVAELVLPEGLVPPQPATALNTMAIVVLMTVVLNAFFPTLQPLWGMRGRLGAVHSLPAATPRASIETSPLFERIPPSMGTDIVCIRADNHHIEITTLLGQTRVLMRLGDAEADLADLPGQRVHRSWWLNYDHAVRLHPSGRDIEVETITGQRVPIARAQQQTLRLELARRGVR